MKIKKIILKNIRSYENQEINFPDGSLLLAGDIGSGKTSILLAIEYALFGLQPGQKGSALLRNNSDNAEVSLEIEVDGKKIIIDRKLKKSSRGISNEYSALTIDGNKIESSTTEIKTMILKILNYPSEFIKKNNLLYKYTIYTPQEQMKQIITEDPETRLNVLRHIFGVDKYKRIRENTTLILTRLKEEVRFLQGTILDLDKNKQEISDKKAHLLILIAKSKEAEFAFEEKKKERKKIELDVKSLEAKLKEKIEFENEIEKTKIVIATKKESIITAIKEINDLEKSLSEIKSDFNEKKYQEVISSLLNKNNEVEKINNDYISHISEINMLEKEGKDNLDKKDRVFSIKFCPVCLQNVSEPHKHNILLSTEKRISEIKTSLVAIDKKREIAKENLEKVKLEIKRLEESKLEMEISKSRINFLEKSKIKKQDLEKNKESFEKDINFLIKHIDGMRAAILGLSKYDNMLKSKQIELKNLFSEERKAEISYAEFNKEIEFTKNEIHNKEISLQEKEKSKLRLTNLQEVMDWLSNYYLVLVDFTERNVLIKLRSELSKLFNKWFNMLVPENFEARLDENFTPLIIQSGVEMDYSFLSGGERTAVALAYRFALNQTINSILSQIKTKDIVILDEPTEGFSEMQIDRMKEVLAEFNISQLIIVSHEQKIESFVENIIKIKKEQGISEVEYVYTDKIKEP